MNISPSRSSATEGSIRRAVGKAPPEPKTTTLIEEFEF
jgi:hypothetical protein